MQELELLDQLAKDGHDVMGAKIRVIAMRDALEWLEGKRAREDHHRRRLLAIAEEMEVGLRQRGKNVVFNRLPNPNDAIDRHVYADQIGGAK